TCALPILVNESLDADCCSQASIGCITMRVSRWRRTMDVPLNEQVDNLRFAFAHTLRQAPVGTPHLASHFRGLRGTGRARRVPVLCQTARRWRANPVGRYCIPGQRMALSRRTYPDCLLFRTPFSATARP